MVRRVRDTANQNCCSPYIRGDTAVAVVCFIMVGARIVVVVVGQNVRLRSLKHTVSTKSRFDWPDGEGHLRRLKGRSMIGSFQMI